MALKKAWNEQAPSEARFDVSAWVKFLGWSFITIIPQAIELYLIGQLYQLGDYPVATLMVFGLVYARVNSTFRAMTGFHADTDKASACAFLFKHPWLVVRSFLFKLDQIQELYAIHILGEDSLDLASLRLATILSESVIQMYLKSIALVHYLKGGEPFGLALGVLLASTACCIISVCLGFLDFELKMGNHYGFHCPSMLSTFGFFHVMTRASELVGRCLAVATFVGFFPFPEGTAAVLIVEELLIIGWVLLYKTVEEPNFLATIRSGKYGSWKLASYVIVVIWPMYWCMHTQRYVESVPRPAFSYFRYYTLRIGFTFARTLALGTILHLHGMQALNLGIVIVASLGGTLAWMVFFPIVRKASVSINGSKVDPMTMADVQTVPARSDSQQAKMNNDPQTSVSRETGHAHCLE